MAQEAPRTNVVDPEGGEYFSILSISLVVGPKGERPHESVQLWMPVRLPGQALPPLNRAAILREIQTIITAAFDNADSSGRREPVLIVDESAKYISPGGGGPAYHILAYALQYWDLLWQGAVGGFGFEIARRIYVRLTSEIDAPPAQNLALTSQEAFRIAAEAINQKFGVARHELNAGPISVGQENVVTFTTKDGANTFTAHLMKDSNGVQAVTVIRT